MRLLIIISFLMFFHSTYAAGNEKTDTVYNGGFVVNIEAGYHGGMLINQNFLAYNSGFMLAIVPGYRVNEFFAAYAGIGIERLEDGVLLPVFASFETYVSKKKKGFVDARIGYSAGFNNRSINIDYSFNGGILFGINFGRDLYANEKVRVAFAFGYNYRRANFNYKPFPNSETITSKFDYNLFSGKVFISLR